MAGKKRVFIVDITVGIVVSIPLRVILEDPMEVATLKDDLNVLIGMPIEIKSVIESTMESL